MDKKLIAGIIIIGLLFMIFTKPFEVKTKRNIPTGESDKGVSLTACISDTNGNCLQAAGQQAIVTFPGGEPMEGIRYITITSAISIASGNVPSVSVTNIYGNPIAYNDAISSRYNKQFNLQTGDINQQFAVIDLTQVQVGNPVEFKLSVDYTYKDARGNDIQDSTFGTLYIIVDSDKCFDQLAGVNVNWGECSTRKPHYCQPGQLYQSEQLPYIPGTLINKASVCGCPEGFTQDGDNCISPCGDLNSGECLLTPNNELIRLCNANFLMVEACQQCGCPNDVYGNPSVSCASPGATDGTDLCQYQEYTATLDINIGSGGYSCTENWQCTAWSTCTAGTQTRTCTDTNSCQSPRTESQSCTQYCGNNITDGTEACDGADLGGQDCVAQGYSSGTLTCSSTCDSFITSNCISNVRFRSLLSDYSNSGNSIAVAGGSCGNNLVRYGYSGGSTVTSTSGTLLLSNLPGSVSNCPYTGNIYLYLDSSNLLRVYMGSSSGWCYRLYSNLDGSGSTISLSPNPVNPSLELNC